MGEVAVGKPDPGWVSVNEGFDERIPEAEARAQPGRNAIWEIVAETLTQVKVDRVGCVPESGERPSGPDTDGRTSDGQLWGWRGFDVSLPGSYIAPSWLLSQLWFFLGWCLRVIARH